MFVVISNVSTQIFINYYTLDMLLGKPLRETFADELIDDARLHNSWVCHAINYVILVSNKNYVLASSTYGLPNIT